MKIIPDNVSMERKAAAVLVLVVGVVAGILGTIDSGRWLIMLCKDGDLSAVIASVFAWSGKLLGLRLHDVVGCYWLPFWVGQLSFYGFVSLSILRLGPSKGSSNLWKYLLVAGMVLCLWIYIVLVRA